MASLVQRDREKPAGDERQVEYQDMTAGADDQIEEDGEQRGAD
jgi:hypothetical protein